MRIDVLPQAIPYLPEEPIARISLDLLPVSQVMHSPVVTFQVSAPLHAAVNCCLCVSITVRWWLGMLDALPVTVGAGRVTMHGPRQAVPITSQRPWHTSRASSTDKGAH